MHEIVVNLHMHTRYSDGGGSHRDIARAALKCGLDAVIVTDHNVLVQGMEDYVTEGKHRVLMLIGEEVHDRDLEPQKNHMLVFGADQEVAAYADEPAALISTVRHLGGLTFIAHPTDPAAPAFGETDITWVDWSVRNFTGIELWNGLSELKTVIPTKIHGVFYAFFPWLLAHQPMKAALQKWDELLAQGHVVAIGGSDAHAMRLHWGFVRCEIYPYDFHFRAINTHVFLPEPLTGDIGVDRQMIYAALAAGHCFVGYDLPLSTRGFRFAAHAQESEAIMGDEVSVHGGVTLQAYLPALAEIRLLRNGEIVKRVKRTQALTYLVREPGVYRIEAYRRYLGWKRGWIFSNPIYVR